MPNKMTVLVVEDEKVLREDLTDLVSEQGLSALSAPNLAEAKAIFGLRKGEIEIVLLDVGLPDGSGLDVIGDLRRLDPHVVIIVLSAYLDEDDNRVVANRRGVFDAVAKGAFAIRQVVQLLEQAQIYRRVLDRSREAEAEHAKLDQKSIYDDDVEQYLVRCLELLERPFADETRVRLVVGPALKAIWELVPERSRERIRDPGSRAAEQVWNSADGLASVLWLRENEARPEWVRDLAPENFPLSNGAALIPIAPADELLGFLELRAETMAYRHHKILERWRLFCDLWGVRLLARLNAVSGQRERLRQLRSKIDELRALSEHFEGYVDHVSDLDVRRRFELELDSLGNLINSLQIEHALLEPGDLELERVDPNLILLRVQHSQAANFEAVGGRWRLDLDDEVFAVELDQTKFGSAIENLVLRAVERFGSHSVETPEIGLRTKLLGEEVRIEVWDNGSGRVPSSREPSGERDDDLELVREAVERMGGTIADRRSEGQGSRFVIIFPHLPEAAHRLE